MIIGRQLNPGINLSIEGKLYRVTSSQKISAGKGEPFMKVTLEDVFSGETLEKNFTLDQSLEEVKFAKEDLEYLYQEEGMYIFLSLTTLDLHRISSQIVGKKFDYLKEGVDVLGLFYEGNICSIELPQFLELTVAKVEGVDPKSSMNHNYRIAILETGARLQVPMFIEVGDVVKVDAHLREYVQRL